MEYIWSFRNLKAVQTQGDLDDVVVSVDYRLAYVCGNCSAYKSGSLEFAAADPEDFIPFADITESDMIAFVEGTLGAEVDTMKADLAALVANPVTDRDLPWLAE